MFASGKNAVTHCQRCGFKYAYNDMRQEAGTKLWVCYSCFDVMDLVNHPQNKAPPVTPDPIALRRPNPEDVQQNWESLDSVVWNYFRLNWDQIGEM